MTTMQIHGRTWTTRRVTLGLLTALAVTLGAVAALLAGTADAARADAGHGGEFPWIVGSPVAAGFSSVENRPGVTVGSADADWSKPGGVGDGVHVNGAKLGGVGDGIHSDGSAPDVGGNQFGAPGTNPAEGTGTIETLGSKCGCSAGIW